MKRSPETPEGPAGAYDEYSDTGLPWLPQIPVGWDLTKVKRIGRLEGGAGFPHDEQGVTDEELPFFKVSDLSNADEQTALAESPNTISRETARKLGASVIPRGSIVFPKVGAALRLNHRGILAVDGCIDNNLMAFTPDCDGKWAFYWWSTLDLGRLANPGALPSVSESQVAELEVPLPPPPTQQAIADFLDRETAKIDTLIEKKQRLLELLDEKRTALITRAVTRGLDPDVPMKDSGVEWIGEIPEHWEVAKIKHVARMESGHTPDRGTPEYWNDGIGWVSLADSKRLKVLDVITETEYEISAEGIANSSARLLPKGTVAFSRDATVGLCALLGREMAVSQHFIAWVCSGKIEPRYLLLVLKSMTQELDRLTMGATIRTLGLPEVGTLRTPLPPLEEQGAIVDRCEQETAQIEMLMNKTGQAIELLREYRIALVSAVVTGKVDLGQKSATAPLSELPTGAC